MNYDRSENLSGIQTPVVMISGMKKDFCKIVNSNSSASILFGYSKNQILNRKVEMLMPSILAQHHDGFVSNYLGSMEGNLINKERFVLAKHKTGYLFPVIIFVKVVENSSVQALHFIAFFKQEKKLIQEAFILSTDIGIMLGLSSNCYNIIKIGLNQLNMEKRLDSWFPDLTKKAQQVSDHKTQIEIEQASPINQPTIGNGMIMMDSMAK